MPHVHHPSSHPISVISLSFLSQLPAPYPDRCSARYQYHQAYMPCCPHQTPKSIQTCHSARHQPLAGQTAEAVSCGEKTCCRDRPSRMASSMQRRNTTFESGFSSVEAEPLRFQAAKAISWCDITATVGGREIWTCVSYPLIHSCKEYSYPAAHISTFDNRPPEPSRQYCSLPCLSRQL